MTIRMRPVVLGVMLTALTSSCHRATPPMLAAAPTPNEEHCWSTAFRTAMPVDTVAARFRQAYSSLGLTVANAMSLVDTAWVNASNGAANPLGKLAGARMVAYRVADSTRFRTYISFFGSGSGAQIISQCQQIAQKAAVHAIAPRESDGEEKLEVWRRRP